MTPLAANIENLMPFPTPPSTMIKPLKMLLGKWFQYVVGVAFKLELHWCTWMNWQWINKWQSNNIFQAGTCMVEKTRAKQTNDCCTALNCGQIKSWHKTKSILFLHWLVDSMIGFDWRQLASLGYIWSVPGEEQSPNQHWSRWVNAKRAQCWAHFEESPQTLTWTLQDSGCVVIWKAPK